MSFCPFFLEKKEELPQVVKCQPFTCDLKIVKRRSFGALNRIFHLKYIKNIKSGTEKPQIKNLSHNIFKSRLESDKRENVSRKRKFVLKLFLT